MRKGPRTFLNVTDLPLLPYTLFARLGGRGCVLRVDVHPLRDPAGQLKCKLGLGVAVGARGSQNQDARRGLELPVTLL
jgi:hypothetical protein